MRTDSRIRILVVDDSPLFRRYLTRALQELPDVELVGTAQNGAEALQKIRAEKPDLVTLDVEMPGQDGLATLKAIQSQGLKTRVVMLSASGGERRTVEALFLGAEDFLLKPTGQDSFDRLKAMLGEKILQFRRGPAKAKTMASPKPSLVGTAGAAIPKRPGATRANIQMAVIGISTGGPNALAEALPELPSQVPVPIVIVQHMPPLFTKMLAERLNTKCKQKVSEAIDGEPLLANHIYIAPGDYHVVLAGSRTNPVVRLNQLPQENGCRPAADVLFRSAAKLFGPDCLAVVMTGMGKDGFEGTRQIVQAGGYAVAQDRESCTVWGMPRFITEAGLAHEILPLNKIGQRIGEILVRGVAVA